MLIVLLLVSTCLIAIWLFLLRQVSDEDWMAAAYVQVLDNRIKIGRLQQKDAKQKKQQAHYTGLLQKLSRPKKGNSCEKEVAQLLKKNERLQSGDLHVINIFVMPGYVLLRRFDAFGRGRLHKNIFTHTFELHGKKHAENKSKQILAQLLSYPILGLGIAFAVGGIFLGSGKQDTGLAVLGLGTVFVLVLVYAIYDEVKDQANKRHDAIIRQFPNVVSKLALLVTSGMIMDRAWKETAFSQQSELYKEMQKTSEELDNLVSPAAAYGGFITRCNTKETAKLASAILQNLSKGNAEIGLLLQTMAKEAWLERRHTARRDSEKANSKLMIPTMLLFLAILVMLMVPVVTSFTGL